MDYKVVELEEKIIVGKSITASNDDPAVGEKIGNLWMQLYDAKDGYYNDIKNTVDETTIGLYSDYQPVGTYTLTVGAEVKEAQNPDMSVKKTPKGKYAKFSVHGNMVTAVAKAWEEIWKTDLDRTFTGDFEHYVSCDSCAHKETCTAETCEDCDIDIYVAIR